MRSEDRLIELPPSAVASDAELQVAATRLFSDDAVRSVTVDRARTVAVVRRRAGAQVDGAGESVNEARAALLADDFVDATVVKAPAVELLSWVNSRDGSISFIRMPDRVRGWRKALYLALATAALSLALLGIVLPGLPTTPFVLLGSYFLVRSSTRLHERLMASRVFGGVLRDWYVHRGLRPHVRARAVAIVAIVVAASLVLAKPPLAVVLLIAALATCGLIVIWRLPSVRGTGFSGSGE